MHLASFRARLYLLVSLLVLPALVLVINQHLQRQQTEEARVADAAITAAKLAAADYSHYINQTRRLLATMSQFQFLVLSSNRSYCATGLANLKLLYPDYADFGLIEPGSEVFCHTHPAEVAGPFVVPALFEKTKRAGDFVLAGFYRHPGFDKPMLQFGYPIMTNGQLARVMYATLKPEPLWTAFEKVSAPDGSLIRVVGEDGTVFAQHPPSGGFEGSHPDVVARLREGTPNQATFEAQGPDGIRRLYALSLVRDRQKPVLSVVVTTPIEVLLQQIRRGLLAELLVILLTAGVLLLVASLYAERTLVRPVTAMVSTARRLRTGDYTARTGLPEGRDEVHLLARSMDEMAAALEQRQAELESRVRERTLELEQLNSELESFSYSVSHDLRAPLRQISGFAHILQSNPNSKADPRTERYLGLICKAARDMGRLIEDLLTFSRTARAPLRMNTVDFDGLVRQIVADAHAQATGREVTWEIATLPQVRGDATMLRQVWINLIDNALKYTRDRNPAVIEITYYEDAGEMVFSVGDNGVGFDMTYAHKLFGVFQRLHNSDQFEGTGIGLANVRRIIQRHGGRTWARATPGKGATFYFSVPMVASEQEHRAEDAEAAKETAVR